MWGTLSFNHFLLKYQQNSSSKFCKNLDLKLFLWACKKKRNITANMNKQNELCPFFRSTSPMRLPAIPFKREKCPTLSLWIRRLQQVSVTGMKNQSPDTHCSQIESLLNPLTMSGTDKEREREGREREAHTNRRREREREREKGVKWRG